MPDNLLGLFKDPDLVREYCKFPSLLLREINGYAGLPPRAMDLWQDFFEMAKFDRDRSVKISINKLCEMLNRSRRAIEQYIVQLENNGFIKRIANYSNFGSQLENTFVVLIPKTIIEKIKTSNKRVSIKPSTPILKEVKSNNRDNSSIQEVFNNDVQYHTNANTTQVSTRILTTPPAKNCTPFKEINIELNINNNTETLENLPSEKSNVVFEEKAGKEKKLNNWESGYVSGMLKNVQKFGVRLSNELFDQVSFSITSEFQFKGSSFKQKVNAISKILRAGHWRTPIGFYNHATAGPNYRERYRELEKPKTYDLESIKNFNDFFDNTTAQPGVKDPIRKDYATLEREKRVEGIQTQISNLDERMRSATGESKALLSKLREVLFDKAQGAMYA